MNKELAKTLTTALVQWIDKTRPEGTMCCSSYECEKLEKAFEGGCYDVVESLIKRKLSGLSEFELALSNYLKNDFEYFHSKKWDEQKWNDVIRTQSKELIALAKKQLLSYADESNPAIEAMADLERTFECDPDKLPLWLKKALDERYQEGYWKGRKEGLEEYNKSVAYHYPEPAPTGVAYKSPQCYTDVLITPNTNSGTSTLKAEG